MLFRKNLLRQVLCLAICVCIAAFSGAAAHATMIEGATQLPSNFLIGDQDGIRVDADGEYYIDLPEVKPGDVYQKKLTIQNLDTQGTQEAMLPWDLKMRAEPVMTEGPLDLLNEVYLTLEMGGKQLYAGRVRGDEDVNMIANALDLGTYSPGDQRELLITLQVNPEMRSSSEQSEAQWKWIFYAAKSEAQTEPPKTGWEADQGMYVGLIAGMAFLCIFLFVKKRRNDEELLYQMDYMDV